MRKRPTRKKTSKIWTTPTKELQQIVNDSSSIAEILRTLGYNAITGNTHKSLQTRMKDDNIDFTHISLGTSSNKGRKFGNRSIPLELVMIENSTYHRGHLKRRLIENGILKHECAICGLIDWNGRPLVMVLDHINGVNNDHRRENLQLVCPNCNSQLPTFCRGNKK